MNTLQPSEAAAQSGADIAALEGEAGIPSVESPSNARVSRKGVVAVVLLALSLIAVTAVSIHRAVSSHKAGDEVRRAGDRPAAAAGDTRRLDMTLPPAPPSSGSARIPAIVPAEQERQAEVIALRDSAPPKLRPEDAPVLLVSSRPSPGIETGKTEAMSGPGSASGSLDGTRRSLEAYQRQLQGVLESLTKGGSAATVAPTAQTPASSAAGSDAASSLFDAELSGSATPRAHAGLLGNRSLTLPKGTAFTCALKTRVISAASGMIGCQVQRNVFGDDGRVLLIERGSHLDGEYRAASVRPGTVRIPVLWTRIRTPTGVTVDIDSPGTGPLGESGIDGHVDNRWPERIGAAMLLSLIDDSVKLAIEARGNDAAANTVVLPSTTSNTSKLAEKVLDSTINIAPLIYRNQGGIVGIHVARDVDFSAVYELRAVER
jgi:type IV secretion system protein VirB10